jgi:histidyl-tRNA synthetase
MPLDPAKLLTVSNDTIAEWTAMQVANPKGKPTPEQAAALKAAKATHAEFMKRVREQTGLEASDKELKKALDERAASLAKAAAEPERPAYLDACSGTRDWYPEDMRFRTWLFGHMRAASEQFGFHEYDAPVLEHVELYEKKVEGSSEDLLKQMYKFETGDDGRVTLRPEMTPSLARLILNHTNLVTGEVKEALPLKWYSIPQCWRYETTQRGRKREHYQWNVDIAGEAGVCAELELLCVCAAFFARVGIGPAVVGIRVNSRRVLEALVRQASPY